MSEQAQKILLDLLQKASNGIDSAVSFSQAQIPDVVNQLLMWNAVSSAAIQALCVLIIILMIVLFILSLNANDADVGFMGVMLSLCVSLITIVVFFNYFDWLKIWLAPKLYLIEYAASLVK